LAKLAAISAMASVFGSLVRHSNLCLREERALNRTHFWQIWQRGLPPPKSPKGLSFCNMNKAPPKVTGILQQRMMGLLLQWLLQRDVLVEIVKVR